MTRRIGFIAALLSITLAPAFANAQWSAPTATPPSNNTSTPVNVSATTQTKAGSLVVGSLGSSGGGYFLGNFAIGNASPGSILSIGDDIGITGAKSVSIGGSAVSVYQYMGQSATRNVSLSWIYNVTAANAFGQLQTFSRTNPLYIDGSQLYLNAQSSAGNVGVGLTNPAYKLDVSGAVGATAFYYTSDRSLKRNVQPLEGSLDKVTKLQGVSFNWKKDGSKSVGLVAQDVEKVYPELVNESPDGIKSVQYGNLVAPLIEAIKAQQKQIDELKAEVAALKK